MPVFLGGTREQLAGWTMICKAGCWTMEAGWRNGAPVVYWM